MSKFAPDLQKIKVSETAWAPWNPNVQDEVAFNLLLESLDELGLAENVVVFPMEFMDEAFQAEHADKQWVSVSGEHRAKGVAVIDPDSLINAFVLDNPDLDKIKALTVRFNVLRGKLDPKAFTDLYDEVAPKFGDSVTREMMGFASQKEFDKLYKAARSALPPGLRRKLDKSKEDIKTPGDLSRGLNELLQDHDPTLDFHFVMFTFGGKVHWTIILSEAGYKGMKKLVAECEDSGVDINDILLEWLENR